MSTEQAIINKVRQLPADKQQEVLDFVEFLYQKNISKPPRQNLLGLWANENIDVSEADIAEVRREMWKNFPRDIDK